MTIITSLLDLDYYKLTMMQIVFHKYSNIEVEYTFKCRNKNILLGHLKDKIQFEIKSLDILMFKTEELEYLKFLRVFKDDFVLFLKRFSLDSKAIEINSVKGILILKIKGLWLNTILYETFLLSIINEVYTNQNINTEGVRRLQQKIKLLSEYPNLKIIEYGTRRRLNKKWQNSLLGETLKKDKNIIGTSNVYFSMKYGTIPKGTMAHEYLQAMQALTCIKDSQKHALQIWADEYRGELGIALTDVIGIDVFLRDFDLYFAKLYDGLRHDSGCPYKCGDKIIKHYRELGVNPITKTIIFSDGLTVEKAIEIYKYFKNRINVVFGIGTNLTNDVGCDSLNIVIKMTKCNNQSVAKISDSPGKGMCEDFVYLNYLKKVFQIK